MPHAPVVITGGSGFLGSVLVRAFHNAGWQVRSVDILPPTERVDGVTYTIGDVRDARVMAELLHGAEAVIHNAALVPLSRADNAFHDVNVGGTRTVLEAAQHAGVRKTIFISSSAVYGIPDAPNGITLETPLAPFETYGKSKVEAEGVCRSMRGDAFDVSIIRPRTVLGPGRLGLLSLIFDWVAENRPVFILGPGKNSYQLVGAEELADVIVATATVPCRNQDFNVGTPNFKSLREDLETFIKKVGSTSRVVSIPAAPARPLLAILDALRLVPLVSYQYRIADKHVFFRMEGMKEVLGTAPSECNADLLARTYQWYRAHPADAKGSLHKRPLKQGLLTLLKLVSRLWR